MYAFGEHDSLYTCYLSLAFTTMPLVQRSLLTERIYVILCVCECVCTCMSACVHMSACVCVYRWDCPGAKHRKPEDSPLAADGDVTDGSSDSIRLSPSCLQLCFCTPTYRQVSAKGCPHTGQGSLQICVASERDLGCKIEEILL